MTGDELKAARALCDSETFDIEERAVDFPLAPYHEDAGGWWYVRATDGTRPVACQNEEDAIFFAAVRQLLPRLLDEVESLRTDVTNYEGTIAAMQDIVRTKDRLTTQDRAELERMRPVFELAQRWCNRPESVLTHGREVLANDAELWREMRKHVAAAAKAST